MTTPTSRWVAVFPGQGSQAPGMGRDLFDNSPAARAVFAEADETLGEPLATLCFEGPEDELRLTRQTQPALLTVSVAAWRALGDRVAPPVAAAGHSLGEYSALVAAGVLSFADALRAVRLRGEAMQAAVPLGVGGMAAVIGSDADAIDAICHSVAAPDEVLVPANFNAPDQIVVAGHKRAVDRLVARAVEYGVRRAIALPVSAPFHCSLMQPAATQLAEFLQTIRFDAPRFPVLSNIDATAIEDGADARRRLIAQVVAPVRWVTTMQRFENQYEARLGIELGAGRVLAGLSRKINERLRLLAGGTTAELDAAVLAISGS